MSEINTYIDEHAAKRSTKQYANSFRVYRQGIEEMLDSGYYVYNEERDGHLYQKPNTLSPIEKIVAERESKLNQELNLEGSKEMTEIPPIMRIPSQKLSVIIKKRNTKRKLELRKME